MYPHCAIYLLISWRLNFKGKTLSGPTVPSTEIRNLNAALAKPHLCRPVPKVCPVQAGTRLGPRGGSCPDGIVLRGLLSKGNDRPRAWPLKRVPRRTPSRPGQGRRISPTPARGSHGEGGSQVSPGSGERPSRCPAESC